TAASGAKAPAAAPTKAGAAPAPKTAAAPAAAPAATQPATGTPSVITLSAPAGHPMTIRVSGEISSATAKAGQRFQGNLDVDLLADGRVVATRGTKVYGRVVAA